uniref:DUF6249 domain-containing protein n=1 Tax=candidate division WOR-3 bacterium TaxID=2052148 RepID=A0A7C4UCW8_UNCW3
MEDVLYVFIPIIALSIPIFAIYFGYKKEVLRRQERMKAIEKGIELPPENVILSEGKLWLKNLKTGIVFLSLGIGFGIMGKIFNIGAQSIEEASMVFYGIGSIFFLVGLGLCIFSMIYKNYEK